ncbi:MAG: 50S ribosomal protein L3 [uncultured bacterium]|nr:MAG: 50S ribosomal protein L3 [uncultured bacterium]
MKKPVTKFLVTQKLYMTQIYNETGNVVPVTVLSAQPNVVTQVKSNDETGKHAVQVGVGKRRLVTVSKAVQGHTKGLKQVFKKLQEFKVVEAKYVVGDKLDVTQFTVGERVKVTGTNKGRGFQGVVKRHHFHGQPASHGHKDQLRKSGSIGAGGVQRVFKGVRMSGQMGNKQLTVVNLKVAKIDSEKQELYLCGAVPGARNSFMAIYQ